MFATWNKKITFWEKLCVLKSLFILGNIFCLECSIEIPRYYWYLKQYSKHRLWPTVLWGWTGRRYTTLTPDQCKDKWTHSPRFNIMELACACDLSFLRSSHTVQDSSLILLNTEWRGTHTSCTSAPQLLHYPTSWSRQSFDCTQAPATEPRPAKASFHSFYFQKRDITKIVCVLILPCQKGIQNHCLHCLTLTLTLTLQWPDCLPLVESYLINFESCVSI